MTPAFLTRAAMDSSLSPLRATARHTEHLDRLRQQVHEDAQTPPPARPEHYNDQLVRGQLWVATLDALRYFGVTAKLSTVASRNVDYVSGALAAHIATLQTLLPRGVVIDRLDAPVAHLALTRLAELDFAEVRGSLLLLLRAIRDALACLERTA